MSMGKFTEKKAFLKKYFLLFIVLVIGFVTYMSRATYSGLWYDEAIEYFFSKTMVGTLPFASTVSTMYDRILGTLQPPLYNVFMFVWLLFFDSELGFRAAGIIVTLIGSIGVFKAIDAFLNDSNSATLGTTFYLFTHCIVSYGLECAEYNLMLCFVAWTVYFYINIFKHKNLKSIVGFFICAVCAVYSQYGASFLIVGLYLSLAFIFIKDKNIKALKIGAIASVITFVFAILPLVIFFMIPQASRLSSGAPTHLPVFIRNGIFDYVIGFFESLCWAICFGWSVGVPDLFVSLEFFSPQMIIGIFPGNLIFFCVVISFFCTVFIWLKKEKEILPFFVALFIAYTCYFFAVACSFYGYNTWNPTSIGCSNLNGKYSMFFVPFFAVFFTIGTNKMLCYLKLQNYRVLHIIVKTCCLIGTLVYVFTSVLYFGIGNKGSVRAALALWQEKQMYTEKLFIHSTSVPAFYFYVQHDSRYTNEIIENVEEKTIDFFLDESKWATLPNKFCCLFPCSNNTDFAKQKDKIENLALKNNFSVETFFDSADTSLLRFVKNSF